MPLSNCTTMFGTACLFSRNTVVKFPLGGSLSVSSRTVGKRPYLLLSRDLHLGELGELYPQTSGLPKANVLSIYFTYPPEKRRKVNYRDKSTRNNINGS